MNWTRRRFLLNGLKVSALVPALPHMGLARALTAEREPRGDRVLVVLQLSGGNDGLNMVVPHRLDDYYRGRPTLALKPQSLHALDEDHGLHPSMSALAKQYQAGRVAVVQGVGSANPDRSHFRSMEVWHTAEPSAPAGEVGWLGKLADQLSLADPLGIPAMSLDDQDLPLSLRAERVQAPTVRDPRGYHLQGNARRISQAQRELCTEPAQGDLGFLRQAARSAFDTADRMQALTQVPRDASYPASALSRKLRLVSDLVHGGFGTRIFHLSLGGFDTHARQARLHEALLGDVSRSLSAFASDLEAGGFGEQVTTLVFSEFGRRVKENGSMGTDHGRAAPVMLMGGAVHGGMHGTAPNLDQLVDGDLLTAHDFRSIYSTLEHDWLGLQAGTSVEGMKGLIS